LRNRTTSLRRRCLKNTTSFFAVSMFAVACGFLARAETVTVGNNGGPTNSFPFGTPASQSNAYLGEYQQLYANNQFSGSIIISTIAFASSATNLPPTPEVLNLTISLSATSATYYSLSTNYAANEDADNRQVFAGTIAFTPKRYQYL
jgi:hypothetical protein